MKKLFHQEIVERQEKRQGLPKIPVHVVLDDIRSAHNAGSIFRTCDGAGVEKLWLCGITGYPPNPQIAKTALDAQMSVAWEYREDIVPLIRELKEAGFQIVVLEQVKGAAALQDFQPRYPVCLVLGNEVEGVNDAVTELADAGVEIEMDGVKNSLNVSVAFGIAAYHLRHQFHSCKK